MNALRRLVRRRRRGSSLYVTVVGTAMIVSLLGLAGMTVVRIEHRQTTSLSDRMAARSHARSAVELALRQIASDADWRTTYASGIETAPRSLHPSVQGTCSWLLTDSDGSLADADTALRLTGIGRVGGAVQVSSLAVTAAIGPVELRSMTSLLGQSTDDVRDDKLWGQYLKPNLPAGATWWWVTSVELYCRQEEDDETLDIRLYEPLANNRPSSNVLDAVSVASNTIGSNWHWHTFEFSSAPQRAADQGICLAVLTGGDDAPIRIAHLSSLLVADSALVRGRWEVGQLNWHAYETDKSLLYRLHGYYTTASGEVRSIAGTWQWDAAP